MKRKQTLLGCAILIVAVVGICLWGNQKFPQQPNSVEDKKLNNDKHTDLDELDQEEQGQDESASESTEKSSKPITDIKESDSETEVLETKTETEDEQKNEQEEDEEEVEEEEEGKEEYHETPIQLPFISAE